MDLLDPPLPLEAISNITPTMARMYEIVVVAAGEDSITLASLKPLSTLVTDELYTFLGKRVEDVIVVASSEFYAALDRYYPPSSESDDGEKTTFQVFPSLDWDYHEELRALARRLIHILDEQEVVTVCIVADESGGDLRIKRDSDCLIVNDYAPNELGLDLFRRLQVIGNLDLYSQLEQSGEFELRYGGRDILFGVNTKNVNGVQEVWLKRLERR